MAKRGAGPSPSCLTQRVTGALEVVAGAVVGGAPPERITGDVALLLRATVGLAGVPGVGEARDRLACVVPGAVDWRTEVEPAVADRVLSRPIDPFVADSDDLHVLAHCALVATDLGRRETAARLDVSAAEMALALALDADDLGLVAEVLWLWPMLGLAWTSTAAFALRLLDTAYDEHGVIPGRSNDAESCGRATLGYGILCAGLALRPVPIAAARRRGPVLALPAPSLPGPSWAVAYRELGLLERSALAPLVLTVVMRRASDAHDLGPLRTALKVAVAHQLHDAPAPRQAAALLRRTVRIGGSHALAG